MRNTRSVITLRLDPLEIALLTMFLGVVVWASWRSGRQAAGPDPVQSAYEMDFFRRRYGPEHYTQREEEWMIRDHFQDRRGGVFVDVGASHYRDASKTYYLESKLGWSGLAIEPQREFAADYATYRPRTKFVPLFVSDVSNETASLYVLKKAPMVASSDKEFVERFGEPDEVREVPTITLTDLLDAEGIHTIDFLSLDIELHEPQALNGFDIERFKPSFRLRRGVAACSPTDPRLFRSARIRCRWQVPVGRFGESILCPTHCDTTAMNVNAT